MGDSCDFVEIYNPTTSAQDLSTWSVQRATSAGTAWTVIPLSGSVAAGAYFLVAATNPCNGVTPNVTNASLSVTTNNHFALVSNTTSLGSCTSACASASGVVDFVGTGTAASFEGTATANPTAANSRHRLGNMYFAIYRDGMVDTNQNANDFYGESPSTSMASHLHPLAVSRQFMNPLHWEMTPFLPAQLLPEFWFHTKLVAINTVLLLWTKHKWTEPTTAGEYKLKRYSDEQTTTPVLPYWKTM